MPEMSRRELDRLLWNNRIISGVLGLGVAAVISVILGLVAVQRISDLKTQLASQGAGPADPKVAQLTAANETLAKQLDEQTAASGKKIRELEEKLAAKPVATDDAAVQKKLKKAEEDIVKLTGEKVKLGEEKEKLAAENELLKKKPDEALAALRAEKDAQITKLGTEKQGLTDQVGKLTKDNGDLAEANRQAEAAKAAAVNEALKKAGEAAEIAKTAAVNAAVDKAKQEAEIAKTAAVQEARNKAAEAAKTELDRLAKELAAAEDKKKAAVEEATRKLNAELATVKADLLIASNKVKEAAKFHPVRFQWSVPRLDGVQCELLTDGAPTDSEVQKWVVAAKQALADRVSLKDPGSQKWEWAYAGKKGEVTGKVTEVVSKGDVAYLFTIAITPDQYFGLAKLANLQQGIWPEDALKFRLK